MNNSTVKMVYEAGKGEIIEKKSRFIANVYSILNEEDVISYINAVKKQYWDAKHNCYAFVLGERNQIQRCSDDGEPAGTAGKPILEVILGSGIENCLIIVTRYFGGTLLGTGGLVRAYSQAAKAGLDNSMILEKKTGIKIKIHTDYNSLGKIQYIAGQMNLDIIDIEYSEMVSITMVVSTEILHEFEKKIIDATAGKITLQRKEEQYFAYNDGKIVLL